MPPISSHRRLAFSAAAIGAALVAWIAGCGSASPSASQQRQRQADAPALITDCMVLHGLGMGPLLSSIRRENWLSGTGVQITPSNEAAFNTWYQAHKSDTLEGKTLAQWQQSTAQDGKLPAALCGPNGLSGMSAYQLQKAVFAKDPAVGNPWPH